MNPIPRDDSQDWNTYRRLVTEGLTKLGEEVDALDKKLDSVQLQFAIDITTLKVKAGVWGAVMGSVVSLIIALIVNSYVRR